MIHVKSNLCGDIRRFAFPTSSSYLQLEKKLRGLHKLEETQKISLQYKDEEDWINLTSDEELAAAIDFSTESRRIELPLCLRIIPQKISSARNHSCSPLQNFNFSVFHLKPLLFIAILLFAILSVTPLCLKLVILFWGITMSGILYRGQLFTCEESEKRKPEKRCSKSVSDQKEPQNVRQAESGISSRTENGNLVEKSEYEKLRDSISILSEMGFKDSKEVINALLESKGNLDGALEILMKRSYSLYPTV